jgi:carbamoyl-phosphate synthase large subunit
MKNNILILSAGRRVELVNCFKRAAAKLQNESRIIAADLSDTAPAIYFADKHYLIPRIGTEGYLETIIRICLAEDIGLVVPTIDTELLILAENREMLERETGARFLVSSLPVIRICRDKTVSQRFFEENGFGVPRQIMDIHSGDFTFPVFIKPLDGSSSIDAFKVNTMEELEFFSRYIKKPLIQEYMEGEEYTVDVFLDFSSHILSMVPRRRLAVRSGEIAKGRIVKDREIMADVRRLMETLKPIGHITVQCMKTAKGIQYIEINPRFGGGAPMSIMAGADSCEKLYRLMAGERLEYSEDYRENLLFLRFDDSIMLDENGERLDG